MIPLLIVVTFMTFMMTYLTNEDPAVTILHAQGTPNITQDLIAETKEKYGLNQPIFTQYKNWLVDALQFKFGTSYITGDPVSERMGPAFMNTLNGSSYCDCVKDNFCKSLGATTVILP